jgi:hypothetical protein
MEDLASIWASSTTSTDDGTELDADVSLRLYRHELRTADQQVDDGISARAAAEDELRQRNAIGADREEARRLFQELNPDEPLPELSEADQLLLTDHSGSSNAPVKDETSSALGPLRSSEQPDMLASSSPSPGPVTASTSGVKRLADHLDDIAEPPPKRHASEVTEPETRSTTTATDGLSVKQALHTRSEATEGASVSRNLSTHMPDIFPANVVGLKRSAEDEEGSFPPAKRPSLMLEPALAPSDSTESVTVDHATSTTSGQVAADAPESLFAPPSASSRETALRDCSELPKPSNELMEPVAGPEAASVSAPDSPPLETPTVEPLDASRQPVPPAQQAGVQLDDSTIVECLVCCRERDRSLTHINSCGHVYCQKCINRLFRKSLRDETLWPPQCCGTVMSFENVRHLLRADLEPKIKVREAEMSIPPVERVYCVNCSAFISKDRVYGKRATCLACGTITCTDCTRMDHAGECQEEVKQAKKQLEALAAEEGWKTCSECHMIVEHNTGCNHMT